MKKSTLQRMLQLSDIKSVIKEEKVTLTNFELVKNSVDGNTYAIVKENRKYLIKQAPTKNGLTESDFDYIGGVANKMRKSFNSFSDATRHLNFMFEEINNHHSYIDNINILESDDSVLSEKKYVLKLNKKKEEKPADDFGGESSSDKGGDDFDFGGDENTEEGGDDFDFGGDEEGGDDFDFGGDEETEEGGDDFDFGGDEETEEEGDDTDFGDEDLEDSDDEIKDIQSTTGKLGQQLRDIEDMTSDMKKWVAKSVLSAIDLDNMDSEDKKDIIRTIKKKSEKEESEEDMDFGGEEEVEESYDSYMDDSDDDRNYGYGNTPNDDPFDGMDSHNWGGDHDPTTPNVYDSYMRGGESDFSESEFNSWMEEMEEAGLIDSYDSYMRDTKEDNPNIGGDEDVPEDKLLFDSEYEMGPEEMDTLYGPNSTRRYGRSNLDRAGREADKDITKHYHKSAAPGYDTDPVEKWAKHKIPYNTKFIDESELMSEDHLNDEMETYEQERAYEDIEKVVRRYGMDVKLREKQTSEDPEESLIYLDIVDGKKKLLVARINSVGDIEVGEMRGNKFSGEPVDSVEDFVEIFGEDLTNKEREDLNMDIRMNPQPQKAPDTSPSEPDTKPGTPEKTPPSERPSRRPFSPPPHITPGEEPGPKAGKRRGDNDVEFE